MAPYWQCDVCRWEWFADTETGPRQCPKCGSRHHAITELAESQASDATIMAIAGHISRQMLEHYSHVRLDLKRKALDGLATRKGNSEGKPTGYDTIPLSGESDHDLSYKKRLVGERGFEPPTPWSRI